MNHREPGGAPELLRAALSLAARGWHIFPCAPGRKVPALRADWQEIATDDPDRIHAWWQRAPYNPGIACGPSGLVVLDLDVPGHGTRRPPDAGVASGADRLAELCQDHGEPYPHDTLCVHTPSGGEHIFFRSPDERVPNSAGKLAPHIDVRGTGGYVVGYGSRTAAGRYEASGHCRPHRCPPG